MKKDNQKAGDFKQCSQARLFVQARGVSGALHDFVDKNI